MKACKEFSAEKCLAAQREFNVSTWNRGTNANRSLGVTMTGDVILKKPRFAEGMSQWRTKIGNKGVLFAR